MDSNTLRETLKLHAAWLRDEEAGVRANLTGANLRDADLSGADLTGANLRETNLTRANVSGANLRDANLSGANLSGANLRETNLSAGFLYEANLGGADLRDAILRDAILSEADLREADLRGADLRGADLSRADLTHAILRDAILRDADLTHAILTGANLRETNLTRANVSGADLRGAIGLPAAPAIPDIDAAILAAIEQPEASLDMREWHTCGTTHCRAGWAIHLAGDAGYELERRLGASVAGALIYAASGSIQVPDWYASDEDAIADMRRRAAKEVA